MHNEEGDGNMFRDTNRGAQLQHHLRGPDAYLHQSVSLLNHEEVPADLPHFNNNVSKSILTDYAGFGDMGNQQQAPPSQVPMQRSSGHIFMGTERGYNQYNTQTHAVDMRKLQVHSHPDGGAHLRHRRSRRVRGGGGGGGGTDRGHSITMSIPEISRYSSNNTNSHVNTLEQVRAHIASIPQHHTRRKTHSFPLGDKQHFHAQSDSVLLDVRKLEESSLVDIVCQVAKKALLDNRRNRVDAVVDDGNVISLKAVELANSLRSKLGVQLLAHVRDVFGGLLNLLERRPDTFEVVRIPKNDHVVLVQRIEVQNRGNNVSESPSFLPTSSELVKRGNDERPSPILSTEWYPPQSSSVLHTNASLLPKKELYDEPMPSSIFFDDNFAVFSDHDHSISSADERAKHTSSAPLPRTFVSNYSNNNNRGEAKYQPSISDGVLPYCDHNDDSEVEKLDPMFFRGLLSREKNHYTT